MTVTERRRSTVPAAATGRRLLNYIVAVAVAGATACANVSARAPASTGWSGRAEPFGRRSGTASRLSPGEYRSRPCPTHLQRALRTASAGAFRSTALPTIGLPHGILQQRFASPRYDQLHPVRRYNSLPYRVLGRRTKQHHGFTTQGVQNRKYLLIRHSRGGLYVDGPFTQVGERAWLTLVHNHAKVIAACDFFVAVTATFRTLYVFVIMELGTREFSTRT